MDNELCLIRNLEIYEKIHIRAITEFIGRDINFFDFYFQWGDLKLGLIYIYKKKEGQ